MFLHGTTPQPAHVQPVPNSFSPRLSVIKVPWHLWQVGCAFESFLSWGRVFHSRWKTTISGGFPWWTTMTIATKTGHKQHGFWSIQGGHSLLKSEFLEMLQLAVQLKRFTYKFSKQKSWRPLWFSDFRGNGCLQIQESIQILSAKSGCCWHAFTTERMDELICGIFTLPVRMR